MHTFNPSTWEAEAEADESLWVLGQSSPQRASSRTGSKAIEKPCLKKPKKKKKKSKKKKKEKDQRKKKRICLENLDQEVSWLVKLTLTVVVRDGYELNIGFP